MIRRILFLGLILGGLSTAANAQADFTLTTDTITVDTTGSTPPAGETWDNYTINIFNYAHNKTSQPLIINWRIFQKTIPIGWFINGFCDNISCRPGTHTAIVNGTPQESNPVAPGDSTQLEPRVAVPVEADNGTAIIRVELKTNNTTDTATYIINKHSTTGITVISVKDTRVAIYPNPAANDLMVFADKSLNAARVSIVNITGAQLMTQTLEKGTEVTNMNVSSLAAGMYFVKIIDERGATVTTRKFSKK